MIFTKLKEIYINKKKDYRMVLGDFIKIDKRAFNILLITEISFAFLNFIGIFLLNNLFHSLSLIDKTDYLIIVLRAAIFYFAYRLIVMVKKIFFDSYYVQFNLMPNFEKKFKIRMQSISIGTSPIKFEDNLIYKNIYVSSVSATNIFRLVELFMNKINLILSFILLSIFFIRISPVYIGFIALSLILGYIENSINIRVINKNIDDIHKYEMRKEELTGLLTKSNYVRDNNVYNVYPLIRQKVSTLFVNYRKLLSENNKKIFFTSLIYKFIDGILKICVYLILGYMLMKTRNYSEFAISFYALKIILDSSEEYLSLNKYQSIFIDMVRPYFEFYQSNDLYDKNLDKKSAQNKIEFKNTYFSYPNSKTFVINDLSISLNKGKTYVIVGENGSGKTTLAKIILGLYKPTIGEFWLDNQLVDINKVNWSFDKTAAFQNYARYPITLIENVNISDTKDNDYVAVELLNKFGFGNMDYNKIYGREIGEDDLSKGQWQRLAIARAVYRDRDFMVFDEPTNDIDPLREKEIFEFLNSYKKDRTLIIISHKLFSIKLADEIIVMDDGKIIQRGSYSEIVNEYPFKKIWESKGKAFK